jgi:hypothetical protein
VYAVRPLATPLSITVARPAAVVSGIQRAATRGPVRPWASDRRTCGDVSGVKKALATGVAVVFGRAETQESEKTHFGVEGLLQGAMRCCGRLLPIPRRRTMSCERRVSGTWMWDFRHREAACGSDASPTGSKPANVNVYLAA